VISDWSKPGPEIVEAVEADAVQDQAPDEAAEAPEENAEAPEENAEAPEENAEAPEENAGAPKETAGAPEENAEAPEKSAEAPKSSHEGGSLVDELFDSEGAAAESGQFAGEYSEESAEENDPEAAAEIAAQVQKSPGTATTNSDGSPREHRSTGKRSSSPTPEDGPVLTEIRERANQQRSLAHYTIKAEDKAAKVEQGYVIFTSDGGSGEDTRPTASGNGLFAVHPNFLPQFFGILQRTQWSMSIDFASLPRLHPLFDLDFHDEASQQYRRLFTDTNIQQAIIHAGTLFFSDATGHVTPPVILRKGGGIHAACIGHTFDNREGMFSMKTVNSLFIASVREAFDEIVGTATPITIWDPLNSGQLRLPGTAKKHALDGIVYAPVGESLPMSPDRMMQLSGMVHDGDSGVCQLKPEIIAAAPVIAGHAQHFPLASGRGCDHERTQAGRRHYQPEVHRGRLLRGLRQRFRVRVDLRGLQQDAHEPELQAVLLHRAGRAAAAVHVVS
jgi:hypothetical protein